MKISVALASYNGEKYIREQLQSILDQTVPVDEIIVSDDGSKDSTVEIVKSFNDPRIILLQDNVNHGYARNFEHALKHTTGDIIFLSDQDDVWMPNKVDRHLSVFESNPEVGLIITDAIIIDNDGNPLQEEHYRKHLNAILKTDHDRKPPQTEIFAISTRRTLANGMCMCVTRKLLLDSLPFPDTRIGHDHWLSFCASKNSVIYYISDALVKYRIHEANTSFKREQKTLQRMRQSVSRVYNLPFDIHNLFYSIYSQLDSSYKNAIGKSAKETYENYAKQIDLFESSRLKGTISALKLYLSDNEYKRHGIKYFALQVFLILFNRSYITKNLRKKSK